MYRITNSMLNTNYLRNLQTNYSNMSTLQNQLSSGVNIDCGAEDPIGASKIMSMNDGISANTQYSSNIKSINHLLDTSDTALSETNNVLSRIRDLLVKSGNGTYTEDEISSIKDEAVSCVKELGDELNTSYSGNYVFGGSKTDSKAVYVDSNGNMSYADKNGNAVSRTISGSTTTLTTTLASTNQINDSTTYPMNTITSITSDSSGNITINYTNTLSSGATPTAGIPVTVVPPQTVQGQLTSAGFSNPANVASQVNTVVSDASDAVNQIDTNLYADISEGVSVNYNVSASDLLEFKDSSGNNVNAMSILSTIIQDLGTASDKTATSAAKSAAIANLNGTDLTQFDEVVDNFTTLRSKVGTMQNRMDTAGTVNDDQNYNMTASLSDIQDIDVAQKEVYYSSAQTVYKASLQVSSQVLKTTLLDYL